MTNFASKAAARLNSLPPISNTTLKLINLLNDEDYQTAEMAALIEADVTLAARCLKTVNSPLFGIKRAISSVHHAVTLLGARAVLDLALQLSVRATFCRELTGYASTPDDLYRHSLFSAVGARICAQRLIPGSKPENAYTAALFHDIGKLVLSEFLAERQTETTDPETMMPFLKYEQGLFGIDHAQISAQVAEKWHLPDELIKAIAFHHQPSQAPPAQQKTALAVHLGDMFAMMAGTGTQLDNMHYEIDTMIDDFVIRDRKWELEMLPQLMLDINEEYQAVIAKINHEEPNQ